MVRPVPAGSRGRPRTAHVARAGAPARAARWLAALAALPALHAVLLICAVFARRWEAAPPPLAPAQGGAGALQAMVALLITFMPWLFLPLPLWVALAVLAAGRGRVALPALLASALPWIVFGALYGELFLPRAGQVTGAVARGSAEAATAGPTVRVMTFNITARPRPMDGVVAAIRDADPDILLVQELSAWAGLELAAGLESSYAHVRLRPETGWAGTGLWSRYPVLLDEVWEGSHRNAQWQHAVISLRGQPLHVVNLHLTTPTVLHRRLPVIDVPVILGPAPHWRFVEVSVLAPRLEALVRSGEPVIVAGDLNFTDQTGDYRRLRAAGLQDAHRQAGWGFGHTFPTGATRIRGIRGEWNIPVPLLRLDYLLTSPGVRPHSTVVGPDSGGSDHYPVIGDFWVGGPPH
jgi:endonuclease/exonuclease/phosphatase (EEP) superfamily protein YafD